MRVVLGPRFVTGGVGRIRRTCCNRYLSDCPAALKQNRLSEEIRTQGGHISSNPVL